MYRVLASTLWEVIDWRFRFKNPHTLIDFPADIVPRALLEEAMLNRNVNLDQNAKNNDGDTPLHLACKQKNSALVQLLVRDSYRRCKPNAKNGRGDTALHIACQLNEGGKTHS